MGGCHRGLTFWVEKEGSLYYHFCVFVKAKKIFFFFFLFSEGSQSLESLYSPRFHTEFFLGSGSCAPACCWPRSLSWGRENSHQGGASAAPRALGTMCRNWATHSRHVAGSQEVTGHSAGQTVHTVKGLSRAPHSVLRAQVPPRESASLIWT